MNNRNLTELFLKASSIEKKKLVNHLLHIFSSTNDMFERNEIAFFFSDNNIEEGISRVIGASLDPGLRKECGSLIYALSENSNISLTLSQLLGYVEIVAEGHFEASHESFLLIEQHLDNLSSSDISQLREKASDHASNNCKNKDLILDFIDVLDEYLTESK